MRAKFGAKFGIVTITFMLLGSVSWGELEERRVQPAPGPIVRGPFHVAFAAKRMAVLPLADHSHQESFSEAVSWGGNEIIVSAIRDYLASKEIEVSDQQGVNDLLLSMEVIKLLRETEKPLSFDRYLAREAHSPLMTRALTRSIGKGSRATVPLSGWRLQELGRKLGIDSVVRGMISERVALKFEAAPWEREPDAFAGLSPFKPSQIGQDFIGYGSPGYEEGVHPVEGIKPIKVTEHLLVPPPGQVILEIRLYFQDVNTGEVGWSNQAEFLCPVASDGKTIGPQLRKAVNLLLDDLFINYLFYYKGDWLCLKGRSPAVESETIKGR